MLNISDIHATYLRNGSKRYYVEITHRGLKRHQVIKGENPEIVRRKAQLKAAEWTERWDRLQAKANEQQNREDERRRKESLKEEAADRTSEALETLNGLEAILAATLDVDDTVDWSSLEDHSDYAEPAPVKPGAPGGPELSTPPAKPLPSRFEPTLGLLDKVIRSRGDRKRSEARAKFDNALHSWEKACQDVEARNLGLQKEFERSLADWNTARLGWEAERDANNDIVRAQKESYLTGDADAIEEYCDLVLSRSMYPDAISLEHEVQYLPETRTLIVETQLPAVEDIPTLREVKYVQTRDEFDEKHISDVQIRKLYDSVLYQICLRTIHELFEADAVNAIDAIALNGNVTSIDRATGQSVTACILSIQVSKEEFLSVNLAAVDPKACFKKFKGVGSSKLHSLTPIAPIMQLRRDDGRFISAREITSTLHDAVNLAAMDWEDFEHLIRELFEQEFEAGGGEVKVTQASRDGGVDAIAFDPDPIRGGKIVIQAKRYTNTVGVAAVRDLYGTVMNEGATKGILVTTSDYGPDAYAFAKDKPLSLLSGANLLHLLQKHGHRAKIDIKEARNLLAE